MARCPQGVHSSRCPPSMAVRHRAMASRTLTCCQVIHLRLRSMNASPTARTRSATSRGGRSIYSLCGGRSFSSSESRGLPVGGDVQRDGDRWWFLPDRDALAASGWFADPRLLQVDVWRSSVSAYEGARLSAGLLAGRLPCKRSRPPWCQSAYHRYASGCLETAMRLACAVIRASAHAVPRAVLD